MQIEDGKGAGKSAEVDSNNRLVTKSFFESDFDDAIGTITRQDGYTLTSTFATGTTDVEVISLKNISTTQNIIIDTTEFSSTVATLWTLFEVTSGTAAGTTGTARNMNLDSGNTAAARITAFANASVTGTLTGNTLAIKQTGASSDSNFNTEGIFILGTNDEISLTASANGTVAVTMYFHFKDK